MDLATAVGFDGAAAHRNIQAVRPGKQVWEVSARSGEGMEQWLLFLEGQFAAARRDRESTPSHTS
jgi:hydrogenase nickel incorporation protein HypB